MNQPRRVLLISATIGEGHNATARAIEEAARRSWPGCAVSRVDTLEAMGRWVPRTFRWIYTTNVESTPWLYEFFYAALWRSRWFADACRRFVGSWSGRRLRPSIAAFGPDLVISTYPMGTAGLDWLRRRKELDVPLAAVVSDFAPHPFWVYPEIDMHYVMSLASVREAQRAKAGAAIEACAPPVFSSFRPVHKAAARRAFDLPENGFVVAISCGAMGFGSIDRAVDVSLHVPGVARVVAVCGSNERLRGRLTARDESGESLVVLGWVEDMATLTGCTDVVVTNAGGATALEALACGRTVVMFEPIAAHGRANAELMASAGLAELCLRTDDLFDTLQRLASDPKQLAEAEEQALRHSRSGDFTQQVAALARLPRHTGRRSLRSQDAFFVYAATPEVAQQAGAVLHVDGRREMSAEDWRDHLTGLLAERVPGLAMLHRRIIRRPGRRPVWAPSGPIDPGRHVRCRELHADESRADVLTEFFTTPLPPHLPPWELLFVRDRAANHGTLLAKMHHALGDGFAVTSTLLQLLRDEDAAGPRPSEPKQRETGQVWWRRGAELVRGFASLAGAGSAPHSGLEGRSSPARRFAWVELPAAKVRASARAYGVSSTVLLLSVVAEAMYRLLGESVGTSSGQRFRAMVPRTARSGRGWGNADSPGNRTVALAIDLPVGPMPPDRRVVDITFRLEESKRNGQPAAAGAVLAALGLFPAPLHAWAVRRIYRRRFFNAIVSVLPGPRQPPRMAGALISKVFPVLPLADGIALSIGAITWGEMVGFGLTADAGLLPAVDELADHIHGSFDDLQAAAGAGRP